MIRGEEDKGLKEVKRILRDDLKGSCYFLNAKEDFKHYKDIINCTDLSMNIEDIKFASDEIKLLGQFLGTADLLSQMAYRNYLERLFLLYDEFEEGGIKHDSKLDLLRETVSFYDDIIKKRLEDQLGGMNKYIEEHLKAFGINNNPYIENIEKSIEWARKNQKKPTEEWLRRKV